MICQNKATIRYVWPGRQVFYACSYHYPMVREQARSFGFVLEAGTIEKKKDPECSGKMTVNRNVSYNKDREIF